ncbi:MAG: peptide deformylase [Calditrichaeota bacterium]|nr:peptide deformylase [Calditrichota bacterium]MCB9391942.1 peptide deformylase [Calditrichota bacterium]
MERPYDEQTLVHDVIIYGHPTLRRRADDVSVFDDDLRQLVREMFATMEDYDGIGLAAPQIDKSIRLLVIGVPGEQEENKEDEKFYLAVLNPVITSSSGSWDFEEGCLSIPDIRETVTRPESITMEYDTPMGEHRKLEATGILARVLQHEIDHLNGVLFIDHLSPIRRGLLNGRLKRLERDSQE